MPALFATSIKSLPLLSKGKVRDVYALGDDKLLMITTDRLSAFDVVMGEPIPEKGIVLNQMANFWFDKLASVIPNHLTGIDPTTFEEAVGSACISFEKVVELIGEKLAKQIREVSIRLYKEASEYAATRGIIIADTKFEFGLDDSGQLVLMDEILTADSSRFWPAETYYVGSNPPSYDKQFVRDWLETAQVNGKLWPKTAPAPQLPANVIEKTAEKYREALNRLTQG